jgi:hypothetical protein
MARLYRGFSCLATVDYSGNGLELHDVAQPEHENDRYHMQDPPAGLEQHE